MADAILTNFVKESLLAGVPRKDIEKVLIEAGWSQDQVNTALDGFCYIDYPVPVPRPRQYLSARDAFLYLVMFGMLYLSSYHLGNLLFQFVNLAFPDSAQMEYGRSVAGRIRFSTSALLIAFPVFLFMAYRIARLVAHDPAQRGSAIRKWLTYLTLAAAAGIIVGDLIFLLNSMLSGELTVRFILKALIVGVVSGSVLAWLLWSMREDDEVQAR